MVIIPPEMAICVIEVKSVLAHTNLQEALENIKSSKELMPDPKKLTGYIFSYDSKWSAFDIVKPLLKCKTIITADYYPEAIICLSKFIAWIQEDVSLGRHYKLTAIHPYFGGDHTMAFFWGTLNTALAVWTGDIARLGITSDAYVRKFYEFDRGDRLWLNDTKVIIGSGLTPQDEEKLELNKANDKSHQCLRENRLSDAYKYAQQALHIKRTEYSLFNLAQALKCDGKYGEALTLLDEAISINDTHYLLSFEKGGILFLTGDYLHALQHVENAITKCTDEFQREPCYCLKYRILLQQGNYQEVLNSFDRDVSKSNDIATKIWKAFAMIDSGAVTDGKKLLEELLNKILEGEEEWEISKAIILVKLGKKKKPKELIKYFITREPIFQKTVKDMPELRSLF